VRTTEYTTPDEMRLWLREAFGADPEASLVRQLARRLRDPASGGGARWRAHPLWLTLGLVLAVALCGFVGFTLVRL
jgi:hypothetical protein